MPRHKTTHQLLHDRIAGFLDNPVLTQPIQPRAKAKVNQDLLSSQWSPAFEDALRCRLQMGALRYGGINNAGVRHFPRVEIAIVELQRYLQEGRTDLERLVDAANYMLLEFEYQIQNGKKLIGKDRV